MEKFINNKPAFFKATPPASTKPADPGENDEDGDGEENIGNCLEEENGDGVDLFLILIEEERGDGVELFLIL